MVEEFLLFRFQDELIGQLDFYLNESYRSKFSRFYFLSNEDLIALISTGLDPRSYLPTVRQLFRGIQSINYHLPQQLLASTNSQTINSATIDVYGLHFSSPRLSSELLLFQRIGWKACR